VPALSLAQTSYRKPAVPWAVLADRVPDELSGARRGAPDRADGTGSAEESAGRPVGLKQVPCPDGLPVSATNRTCRCSPR
jgi:hypothetical protein